MTMRIRAFLVLLCLIGLASVSGCGGCGCQSQQKTPEELAKEREEKTKEKEKQKKPPFEIQDVLSQPTDLKRTSFWCKPGHWTESVLVARSNEADFDGELELSVVAGGSRPVGLQAMPYSISSIRPAALPKEQVRMLEAAIYVPPDVVKPGSQLGAKISHRHSGRLVVEAPQVIGRMPAHQYHFLVLARFHTAYGFLQDLPSFKDPLQIRSVLNYEGIGDPSQDPMWKAAGFYRVTLLNGEKPMLLPSQGLTWTSIAYVLWDAADPAQFRQDQRAAMLDWLHWGGQLIISGPDSLEGLKHSFLESYLPAQSKGERKISRDDLQPLSDYWKPRRTEGASFPPVVPSQPWSGVQLERAADARFVPSTGELVAERRVGRGRVVVTAFPLNARELVGWSNFDNFFNSCLLARPPRQFYEDDQQFVVRMRWANRGASDAIDPKQVCKLRYFSRDIDRPAPPATAAPDPMDPMIGANPFGSDPLPLEERINSQPDVGAWNDFNAVADAARNSLKNAAQIEVPKPSFVLWVLGGYLLVLVPLNWAFFRLIDRVEWAWVAAPIIAIACTVVVIRLARLDIGFARSATEIDVVELQGDYSRAHVTRYTALYSSLFTRYTVSSEDPGSQVQPFPVVKSADAFQLSIGQALTVLQHHCVTDSSLHGFTVSSNSTNFLHGEQMADLGGAITLTPTGRGDYQLKNGTNYALEGVGLIRRGEVSNGTHFPEPGAGGSKGVWIGKLPAGATVLISLAPDWESRMREEREASPVTATSVAGELSLRELIQVAERVDHFEPGEVRLIGWTDAEIPGQVIEPASPQTRRATLFVAHLRFPHLPDPRSDIDTPKMVGKPPAEAEDSQRGGRKPAAKTMQSP